MFLNRGGTNHWLTLNVAIGAKVKVGNQWGYSTTAGSYLSASDGRVHFGLGSEKRATVEITFPGGKRQVLSNVAADQILTVKEAK